MSPSRCPSPPTNSPQPCGACLSPSISRCHCNEGHRDWTHLGGVLGRGQLVPASGAAEALLEQWILANASAPHRGFQYQVVTAAYREGLCLGEPPPPPAQICDMKDKETPRKMSLPSPGHPKPCLGTGGGPSHATVHHHRVKARRQAGEGGRAQPPRTTSAPAPASPAPSWGIKPPAGCRDAAEPALHWEGALAGSRCHHAGERSHGHLLPSHRTHGR